MYMIPVIRLLDVVVFTECITEKRPVNSISVIFIMKYILEIQYF